MKYIIEEKGKFAMEEQKRCEELEFVEAKTSTIGFNELLSKRNVKSIVEEFPKAGVLTMRRPWLATFHTGTFYVDPEGEETSERIHLRQHQRNGRMQVSIVLDNGISYPSYPSIGYTYGFREFEQPVSEDTIVNEIQWLYDLIEEHGSLQNAAEDALL